jgi:outer membrane protein, heavy metal efflux system
MNPRVAFAAVLLYCISAPIAGAQEHHPEVRDGTSSQPPKQDIQMGDEQQRGSATKAAIPIQLQGAQDILKDALGRPAMSLDDFEQLALANNPTLPQANAIVRRSAGQARQAGLFPNPTVGYVGEEIRGGSYGGGEQGAFVQQTIPLGGKLGLRRQVFEEQRREDEISVNVQRYRVLSDVRQSFYAALAAQETVKLEAALLSVASDAVQTAHQLANVGQADAPDVLQAEVEAEQVAADYTVSQRTFIEKFSSLAAETGRPELPVGPLRGELENPPRIESEELESSILEQSPEVKRAEQAVIQAEAKLRSASRERLPDLQLRAGLQQSNEPVNEITGKPVGLLGFATVGVTLPLFNRNQGNVAAARADLERARSEVTRLQLSLRRRVQPLIQTYLADRDRVDRYRTEMIPRATRAYQLYLSKYRQMGQAYPQVIVSQRTLFQIRVAYLQVLQNLWTNVIRLQSYALSGGLDAPVAAGSTVTNSNVPSLTGSTPMD